MSDLGDKLVQAIEERDNNINNWIWINDNNKSKRLLDMDFDELQEAYTHVLDMLYRRSNNKYGKYEIRKNIQNMYTACNAELFHRYIQYNEVVDLFKTNKDILDFINTFKEQHHVTNDDSILKVFSNIPKEYDTLTVGDLLKACLDSLYPISRKIISNKFIISLGIWLTTEDKKNLTEFREDGTLRPWIEVLKERLFINGGYFKVSPSGLSYSELRSLINLQDNSRVSTLSSETLRFLRDKILLQLDNNLEYHINKWNTLKQQIEKVADYKDWKLVNKYAN